MWIKMQWQHISPEVTVKGFMKFCISHNDMLWNDREKDRDVKSECKEDMTLTVKMEIVTLIGKGTQIPTYFVY
jgi:aspartokinase